MTCSAYDPHVEAAAAAAERALGRLFAALLEEAEFLTAFNDGETYQLDVTTRSGRRLLAHHERPADLVRAALGVEERKRCNGPCGEQKPLRAFNRDANNPDGLLRRCKGCEARRVADYKRERKRLREGGGGA